MQEMPSPSEEERDSPLFKAIWNVVKTWDVNVPAFYEGYCEANGSHVKLILDALAAEEDEESPERELSRLEDDMLEIRDALGDDVPINAQGIIAAINERRKATAFAVSMIRSGEPMTPEAEAIFQRAGITRG